MSFDTDFDYTLALASINEQINLLQTSVDSDTSKITMLQSSPYANMVAQEMSILESDNIRNIASINNYRDIIDEIVRVRALGQPEKDLLHYFYTTLGVSRTSYMIKLLFNTHMASDPRVVAVYTDTTSSNDVRLLVAQMLYKQFSMSKKCVEARLTGMI